MAGVKGRSGGSNRKSVEELKLTGTYVDYRHKNITVPEDQQELVEPQNHVTDSNAEIDREAIFDYFAQHLHEQGMTKKIDSVLLSQLVEAQSIYIKSLNFYKRDPEATLGRKLASTVAMEAAREVRILLSEFRLTPTSRTVNLDPKKVAADPVADFLDMRVINK
ncbi:P27 family phage terminase small subunit [Yoonia sp.]|uniref:P27 family phage terminase small subunit n=1 Tax=Yoonia sp. TaxID=2212373 RepID=UPI00391CC09F